VDTTFFLYPDTWISWILIFFGYMDNWILGYHAYLDTWILGYMDIRFHWIHGYFDTLDIKFFSLSRFWIPYPSIRIFLDTFFKTTVRGKKGNQIQMLRLCSMFILSIGI
jgi:hypothetical protein